MSLRARALAAVAKMDSQPEAERTRQCKEFIVKTLRLPDQAFDLTWDGKKASLTYDGLDFEVDFVNQMESRLFYVKSGSRYRVTSLETLGAVLLDTDLQIDVYQIEE